MHNKRLLIPLVAEEFAELAQQQQQPAIPTTELETDNLIQDDILLTSDSLYCYFISVNKI